MMKKSTSQQGILRKVLSKMEKAREEKLGDPFDLGITGLQTQELQSLKVAIENRLKKSHKGENWLVDLEYFWGL